MEKEFSRTCHYGIEAVVGVGGIGRGIFFQLEGEHTLGRDESREGVLLDARDFCKLHIIEHYIAVLLGPLAGGDFRTMALGRVGDDGTGREIVGIMQRSGIDTSLVTVDREAATMFSVCFQYPDSSGGNITTSNSASARLRPEDIQSAGPLFGQFEGRGIALAAPEVPLETRHELLHQARSHGFLTVSSFTSAEMRDPQAAAIMALSDTLVLNRDEAQAFTGLDYSREGETRFLNALEEKISTLNSAMQVCLTLGAMGSVGLAGGSREFTPPARVKPLSTAGAGDATTAGIIIAMVLGLPFILPNRPQRVDLDERSLTSALDLAALLASFSVTSADTIHLGTSRATLAEHACLLGLTLSPPIAELLKV